MTHLNEPFQDGRAMDQVVSPTVESRVRGGSGHVGVALRQVCTSTLIAPAPHSASSETATVRKMAADKRKMYCVLVKTSFKYQNTSVSDKY
jgi:hypothetical protein